MSALRLLRDAMASQPSARLDLGTLSSLRTDTDCRAVAAASVRLRGLRPTPATASASLVNDPG